MQENIPLTEVVYDKRARDGTWCCLPYPNHPKGCPNFPKCMKDRPDFKTLPNKKWIAVLEKFDLKAHAERMKEKHPKWSERQARCVLYWQNSLRKRLREKAMKLYYPLRGDIFLDIPEANGINVFATMAKHGIYLRTDPDLVYKIMLVGIK